MEKYYQKIKEFAIYESDFAGILSERTFLAETWSGTAGVFGMGFALSLLLLVDMGTDPCSMMSKSDFRKDRYEFWKLAGTDEHGASGTGCNLRRKKSWLWNAGEYVSHRILCRLLHMDLEPGTADRLFYHVAGSDRSTDSIGDTVHSDSCFIYGCGYGTAPYDAIPIIISDICPKYRLR